MASCIVFTFETRSVNLLVFVDHWELTILLCAFYVSGVDKNGYVVELACPVKDPTEIFTQAKESAHRNLAQFVKKYSKPPSKL